MSKKGTQPHFKLRVKQKHGEGTATVGSAWFDPKGFISINLNPGTMLHWNDDLLITLFPEAESKRETILNAADLASRNTDMAELDRSKIQKALAHVHLVEKRTENPEGINRAAAVGQAIDIYKLNESEQEVLLNVTHVSPEDIA